MRGTLRQLKQERTWSAVMPFMSALLTLSLVIMPTTKFGKRYFNDTKRLSTAVWSGLSKNSQLYIPTIPYFWHTCIGVYSIIRFEDDKFI
jgi:hypothetical protein